MTEEQSPKPSEYDSRAETCKHIDKVREFIGSIQAELTKRAELHDQSKLTPAEKPFFDQFTPLLSETTYGSPEYQNMLLQMQLAVDHHHRHNAHRPEFGGRYLECDRCRKQFRVRYKDYGLPHRCDRCGQGKFTEKADISAMTLIDVVEMLCDWKAATLRHDDGDIRQSIWINAKKLNLSKEMVRLFFNTVRAMEW